MNNERRRVTGELVGAPIVVGDVTVTPVARVDGMLAGGSEAGGQYEAGFLRLKPVRAVVSRADGDTTLKISDVHGDIQRNMTIAGGLLAVVSVAIAIYRKLR